MIDLRWLQNLNRLGGMFGGQEQTQQQPTFEGSYNPMGQGVPQVVPGQTQGFNPNAEKDPFNNVAGDALSAHLKAYPERGPVSNWRKLGAAIAGMGSNDPINTTRDYINFHHDNKLKDWAVKGSAVQQAANTERLTNQSMMQQLINERRMEETERKNREIEALNREKLEVTQQRADTSQHRADTYRAISRGGQMITDEAGNTFVAFKDGSSVPVNINQFSTKELEELRNRNRIEQIEKQGDIRKEQIAQQGNIRSGQIQQQGAIRDRQIGLQGDQTRQNITTRQVATGVNFGGRPESETQKTARLNNLAKEAISKHPEWAQYIQMDDSGRFLRTGIPAPTGGLFGYGAKPSGDPKVLEQVNNFIFGNGGTPGNTTRPSGVPSNYVRVVGPNGQTGWMSPEELRTSPGWKAK
jgi:hypothetical protein